MRTTTTKTTTLTLLIQLLALLAAVLPEPIAAWSSNHNNNNNNAAAAVSRRQAFQTAIGKAAVITTATTTTIATATPSVVLAEPPAAPPAAEEQPRTITRMGGLLEPFQDSPRSIRIMAPSGWNKFEGEVGAYDLKWQDLVDPTENIKVSSTPVKSTTESVAALGPVQDVGAALAAKRNAKLVAATERVTDGITFYTFDFALADATHQLLLLCVSKGKLWSVDANAKEKRWSKRAEMYQNVLGSFMPKLA